jgi:hypothetical protein
MSLNTIKKYLQIPAKGDNETLKIVNPMKHMTAANAVIEEHVPENGGTCVDAMQGRSVSAQIHHVSEGGTLEPRKRTRSDEPRNSNAENMRI